MHLYWRMREELKYLGETLIIHDPSLLREFNKWIQKRVLGLGLMEDTLEIGSMFSSLGSLYSLN